MRKLGAAVLALGALWLARAPRAQPPEPEPELDLEFLEYLGSWQAEDDEWLAIEQWQRDNGRPDRERNDDETQRPDEERNEHDEGE